MPDTFFIPHKIQVILASLKAVVEVASGLDSSDQMVFTLRDTVAELKQKLLSEIDNKENYE